MNELFRLAVKSEVQAYLEEEKEKEIEKQMLREEKEVKATALVLGIVPVFLFSILLFATQDKLSYLLYFSCFHTVSVMCLYGILKTKYRPEIKKVWMIVPSMIGVCSLTVSMF